MLNNIVSNCIDYETFKKWYVDGTLHNPIRDKLYLEAASEHVYFDKAKELIINYNDWRDDTNERIKEFAETFSKDAGR